MKIIDKRKFTSEGELREEYRGSESPSSDDSGTEDRGPQAGSETTDGAGPESAVDRRPSAESAEDPERSEEAPEVAAADPESGSEAPKADAPGPAIDPRDLPPPEFMEVLEMLVQPALIYLGDLPLPDGRPSENLPLAKRQIDLLELLKAKTEGNLTSQESSVFEDLLYRLRMRYVQKTG